MRYTYTQIMYFIAVANGEHSGERMSIDVDTHHIEKNDSSIIGVRYTCTQMINIVLLLATTGHKRKAQLTVRKKVNENTSQEGMCV